MKKKSLLNLVMLVGALMTLPHCGGGGGGGNPTPPPPTQPTTAVLTLSTAMTSSIPSTTTINGYDVTITLPAGVTVKASPDSVNGAILMANPGVVTATGAASGSQISAVYTAAANGMPAMVKVHLVSANGFGAGTFCTITCDIATGTNVLASDFIQPTLDDATGIDASVNTVSLTRELSISATAVIQ